MQSALASSKLDPPLRKNLTAIFLTGLFFWSSMASQLPTLPLYLNTLTQSLDEVGLIMGSFAIGLLACRSYLGKLTDRRGRTYTMRIGLAVAMIVPLCYALFPSIPLLIFFRAIHGISIAAFASSYSALIADLAPIANRGKIIGYMSLVNPLGLAIGPALGGAMYQFWGYQALFVVASLFALSGLLLTSQIKIVEVVTKTGELVNQAPAKFWQTFLNPRIRVICTVLLIVGIAFGTISAFMPILMQQKQITMNAGVFYMSAALSGFMIRLPLARLSDSWGRGIFISVGIMCYGSSLLIIYLASQDYHFVISGIMEGIGAGIVIPTVVALLADRTVPLERGYVFGLTWIGFDVGIAMAGPIMGKLTGLVGVNNIFAITTGLCLVGLWIFATQSNKTVTNSLKFAIGSSKDDDYAIKPVVT
ncbi:MFS transporter [Pseudanabaena sp. FACHB-1277]|uniref:MFS transporter n=1 Tax=Pseudanabaena cinerea FACHB-1277 TaxID=2949581 RepID=A0A926UQH2_9CYAN|nr:MFS transporter [Pseudanabaena cinerea]MBD2149381.1 MFS transporter [Pseudanabaena cinerea FACHB-1277]